MHPKVKAWLDRHPRWIFHFTPKSGSWLVDLQAAINRYLEEHNDNPKPFVWTKPADAILAKLTRLPVPSV